MDRIELPFLDPQTSLTTAVRTMVDAGRAGLVTGPADAPSVIDLEAVIVTLNTVGDIDLGSVEPRTITVVLPPEAHADSVFASDEQVEDIESRMDYVSAAFVVVDVSGDVARVITRHEGFAGALYATPTLWLCAGDPSHVISTRELAPGNRCPYDGAAASTI